MRAVLALVILALLLLFPMLAGDFMVSQFILIGIYSLVALGLVLLTGIAGMTSFGQAAFMGVGAYISAVLCTQFGFSPWLTLIISLLATAGVAAILGMLTLRMQGHYLPLATIAWGISLYTVFRSLDITNKDDGLRNIPKLNVLGMELSSERSYYYLVLLAVVLCFLAVQNLLGSRVGRMMRALKGGAIVAETFGADTPKLRLHVFLISAVLAALAGWLYAHRPPYFVNPTPFGLNQGIDFLFMAVLGGSGYVWGAALGAGLLHLMRDFLQDVLQGFRLPEGSETIIFGVIVVLMLQFMPAGIWAIVERFLPKVRRNIPSGTATLPEREQPAPSQPLLQVRGVSKQFGGLRAVGDMEFDLQTGEILGLIGPNGAGKSTMFNLISGVLPVSSGEIHLQGKRIDTLASKDIARLGLNRTFQHVKLFPEMTLLDNTMMGAYLRTDSGIVQGALKLNTAEEQQVAATALKQLARVGLKELAFEQAGNLPLGKQRLLEIARALMADPILLLLDEPAAGLRHLEKQELSNLLKRLKSEGMTILIVEHDMDLVMNLVDRLVVMNYGEKLAEGDPESIQNNPKVLEAYLGGTA